MPTSRADLRSPGQVERQINVCIDTTVARLIEEELDNHVPKKLREQVDKQRLDLLQLQVEIHNSLSIFHIDGAALDHNSSTNDLSREARRANSFIKTQKHFGENLHHLLDSKGRSSDIFPKTVNDLLSYDGTSGTLYLGLPISHSLGPQMRRFCSLWCITG